MKRLKSLLLGIPLFCLVACSGGVKGIPGNYKFQLGADKGTHVGIYATLGEELYDASKPDLGYKFDLKIDANGMMGGGTSSSTSSGGSESPNNFGCHGYYSVVDQTVTPYRLNVGVATISIAETEAKITIPAELVQYIVLAEVDGETLNVTIPVSSTDLLYQIYWYGYKILGTLSDPIVDLNKEHNDGKNYHHAIGTRPTAEDVAAIQAYETEWAKTPGRSTRYTEYFSFHTLKMGLSK